MIGEGDNGGCAVFFELGQKMLMTEMDAIKGPDGERDGSWKGGISSKELMIIEQGSVDAVIDMKSAAAQASELERWAPQLRRMPRSWAMERM